ncbi:MAG: two-component system, chemotaxis family, sensor kinase CheA [Candidatus Magnetoglobus multicellularis str. Araruama]|uniref:histidine kinase n=1 Tax=Candidatus Magnetoglobus multicellularis str. Araruama TaxID=890399 RepID=A0A1V1PHR1_9BACT|nr:MAG: two-component system, chemotaxis family, sensor kinase CheA [Candidatus Magnetoglobus multicellularis str. Araruama]
MDRESFLKKIKEKALTQKLIPEAELKTMTQSQMINTIFVPGFTTSEIITDISGRGMGLDIVKQTIVNELKGTVRIDSNSDAGCTFEIRLPLTMAVMHLLTVKVMGAHFAIPSVNVDEIIRIPSTAVICVADKEAIQVRDALIPIVFLRDILKLSTPRSIRPKFLIIVIVQVDDEKLGLIVDELIDESTFVIKSLPDHLQSNQWITGVVISGNNDIVNILHIPKLIEETGNDSKMQRKETISQKIITPHILVVDDSFSTREIEKSILESYGYDVSLASDGAEAYGMTQSNQYDLVLTDIEMPAMNGFELTQKLRQSDRYAQTPIVLLTSMDQAEHKKRGISAGANAYIVKGDFDQSNLLDVIEGLLAGA